MGLIFLTFKCLRGINKMSKPVIADAKPVVLELEAGNYFWCSCKYSANSPFCDGSDAKL